MDIILEVRQKLSVRFRDANGGKFAGLGFRLKSLQPQRCNIRQVDLHFLESDHFPPYQEYCTQFRLDAGDWHSPTGDPSKTAIDTVFQTLVKLKTDNPSIHCYAHFRED